MTGIDYTFIANIAPVTAEGVFMEYIAVEWTQFSIEVFERTDDHIELFLSKDAEMRQFHEEKGFIPDDRGEGCFMFCARRFPLLQCEARICNVSFPDELKNIEAYDSAVLLRDVWEYTLVLPASIEESGFSRKVHGFLLSALN